MKDKKGTLDRRDFMIATAAAGSAILSGCFSSHNSGWETLTDSDAATLKAVCDQIVPADDFPSASEAGVLTYIDRQLTRHYRHHRKEYVAGLEQANRISREHFGAALRSVSPQQQLAVVTALESQNSAFFNLVREHTLEGFYGSPRHGGNRDAVSWRMLGLDEPPLRGRAQYDLRNQRTTMLGNAFGPTDDGSPRIAVDASGAAHIVLPSEGGYQNNAACVGGGTLSYGGQAWRYLPQDFRMKSTYGAPAASSLEDWPISYDDLEPFYEKAEYEVGVSGDYSGTPFHGPRKRPLPMPPLAPNREFYILEPAARRLGLHPFHLPMTRNSVPYNGRGPCMRCRWCCGFACEVDAKNGSQNTVIPVALSTGNCELRTECMAKEILTDDRGRATGVAYFDADGHLQQQPCDLVVVSACAIESARLLLNSKSRLFPNGIGNRYDLVGRNLQGHHYTGAVGFFDYNVYDDVGPGASIAITDYSHGTPGLCGGGMLANEFTRLPIHMIDRLPANAPRWGLGHKQAMRAAYKRNIQVFGPTQQIPSADARVTLDPTVRDKWGLPVARISGNVHPHTFEIGEVQAQRAVAWLKEAGAISTIKLAGKATGVSAGQNQAGTCRMGSDPRASVVDRDCRIHDVDNVFVIDGSVHVNNGGFNPVLTIMAIAYMASASLVRNWKGTGLKS